MLTEPNMLPFSICRIGDRTENLTFNRPMEQGKDHTEY